MEILHPFFDIFNELLHTTRVMLIVFDELALHSEIGFVEQLKVLQHFALLSDIVVILMNLKLVLLVVELFMAFTVDLFFLTPLPNLLVVGLTVKTWTFIHHSTAISSDLKPKIAFKNKQITKNAPNSVTFEVYKHWSSTAFAFCSASHSSSTYSLFGTI